MPSGSDGLDGTDESHSTRGAIDGAKLADFRDEFERVEPLATCALDDPVNPTVLEVTLDEGVGGAAAARLDVKWTMRDDYNIHYTDADGWNLRWDVHPHDYPRPPDDRHFHPPPNAANDPKTVEESCIQVTEVALVAHATHRLWRRAYERGAFDGINEVENPP